MMVLPPPTLLQQGLQSEVVRIWSAHYGKACVGINWELFATQDDAKVCVLISSGSVA